MNLPSFPPLHRVDWRAPATYGDHLRTGCLEPLLQPVTTDAMATAIARHMAHLFAVDAQPRAPTVALRPSNVDAFHALTGEILNALPTMALRDLSRQGLSPELMHVLGSYRQETIEPRAYLVGHDAGRKAICLRYWAAAPVADEQFLLNGRPVKPLHAKWRACVAFQRERLVQRIAWLAAQDADRVELRLDGLPVAIAVGEVPLHLPAQAVQPLDLDTALPALRSLGAAPRSLPSRIKTLALRMLAATPTSRRRFRDAWLFIDRDVDADDSAEHLYRWVRANKPDINAWFVLKPQSPDRARLEAEGFRVISPGRQAQVAALHAQHVVSSHVGQHFDLDRRVYRNLLRYRYTFVPHGISKDDVSHWLNAESIDRFITTCPGEHESIVGDRSPYRYTSHEAKLCGLPRRDALLRLMHQSAQRPRLILFMPTWRASLLGARQLSPEEATAAVRASPFGTAWRRLLNDQALAAHLSAQGFELGLMVHTNLLPVLEALSPPPHVKVYRAGHDRFQPLLVNTCALVTDYSSVAFEYAFMRRAVFYYQFDRESFYSGDHNWRRGYFDYDRDGFGPVAFEHRDMVEQLQAFAERGGEVAPEYFERMRSSHPLQDDQACQRVFEAIRALDIPTPTPS